LWEEHRLRVFENRVLRRIFGPKREEDGLWRKLQIDEILSLYSSPNNVRLIKARMLRWAGHVTCMGEGRDVYSILVGRPKIKRQLGTARRKRKDIVKLDLRETDIDGANFIRLAQDRLQWRAFLNTEIKLRVP